MSLLDNKNVLLYFVVGIAGALWWATVMSGRRSALPLPPSPKPYPLIGHLLSIPHKIQHIGFTKLGKRLGSDIISVGFFGVTIVVVNTPNIAKELLEKRSSIYSDRSRPIAVREPSLMNWGDTPAIINYNGTWRKYRRIMHTWLNKHAVSTFHQSQQHQTRLLLQRLMDKSSSLSDSAEMDLELRRTVSSTLLISIYGYSPQGLDDPFVLGMKSASNNIAQALIPTNFLVNFFPVLMYVPEWFPGAGWKTTLREWRKQKDDIAEGLLNWTKSQMAIGKDKSSIVACCLEEETKWGNDDTEIDMIASEVGVGLFSAGTETTADALVVFLLAMLLFPDVQSRAQREIDTVIGASRLPTVDDKPSLPYIGRLIQEVLRWQPVTPMAIPRVCTEGDEYEGYQIPPGAMVIGNLWAMSRDEKVYNNPEAFDPDRFLDSEVPPLPIFGWGRRICPGLYYVDDAMFITVVSMLASFVISMRKDDLGNDIVPTTECMENSITYHPKPFKFKLTPRSEGCSDLVRQGAQI